MSSSIVLNNVSLLSTRIDKACKQLKTIKGCPTTQEFMIEAAEYYLKELKKKKLIT